MAQPDERRSAHDDSFRRASRRALCAALAVLTTLMVMEAVTGYLTHSLALISDAGHLLTDVAAVALALLAQWFGARPPSARWSFGFRRVEVLAAATNGLTLLAVAGYILYEAYQRLIHPPEVQGWPMLIVALIGLAGQTVTTIILARAKDESLNVRGAYMHAMTDAVQSLGVVVAGVIIVTTGAVIADPIISVVIAVLIIFGGGRITFEALHVLGEGTPKEVDLAKLADFMQKWAGVAQITDLHVWSLTTGYNAMSAHVVACQGSTAEDREALRDELGDAIREEFEVHHVTLQVEESCLSCRMGQNVRWWDGSKD